MRLQIAIFSLLAWVGVILNGYGAVVTDCARIVNPNFTSAITASSDRVAALPGYGCVNHIELAGMLPFKTHSAIASSKLFYWFVESALHSPNTPIVLWLNGGPGSSSLYGFFLENGPYWVRDDLTLSKRQYSWTQQAHFLVIDQPAGVGYSLGGLGVFKNEAQAMDQLYEALRVFYKRYPELSSNPLYIAGQSYAGKYIPQLAMRIMSNQPQSHIPLKGVLIGDGWVDPLKQQATDADYAYSHGLVDGQARQQIRKLYQACAAEIQKHQPSTQAAHDQCSKMQTLIKQSSSCKHLTNIATCQEPSTRAMVTYLNQAAIRRALHVDAHAKAYATFDPDVGQQLTIGEQDSVFELYHQLLERGVRVVIYNGMDDGTDSNFLGAEQWVSALPWSKQHHFKKAQTCIWRVDGEVAGFVKSISGLTQIKIRHAGHLAPADQPKFLLDLLRRVVSADSFCD
jgi:carboxypeptidase C (cathepsin A)